MPFKLPICAAAIALLSAVSAGAQSPAPGFMSREEVVHYSPEWTGERFPDGRPKVPDAILDRMRQVTLEEAWATLRSAGFNHQYEDGWLSLFPDKVLVGRALTAQWVPGRPDLQKVLEEDGRRMNRKGAQNAWPVDMLQPRDVYVADHFGLKENGPSIGDNVGNAIYARTGNGIVYDGAVRDIEGLKELPNFTAFVRSYDPSHHFGALSTGARLNSTMVSINGPTHIGKATVMPGDVVLGRNGGVLFIPAQLAERVVQESEEVRLADAFGHQRLREKKYTAGEIDTAWTPAIEADFIGWLKANRTKLPVAPEGVDYVIRTRPTRTGAQPGS
ncbi:RraA family protein [Phenylobacterium deserti]|uniref:RraA family protein n=1 Tax=Phenylobacterium deserti TaxID=1914756 RepID=A0A328AQ59_9CAUL|nr:RraA family protein [Phenylobacterium deserti]RAK57143.1 RraA family protein [Phenylobacterium deserti]